MLSLLFAKVNCSAFFYCDKTLVSMQLKPEGAFANTVLWGFGFLLWKRDAILFSNMIENSNCLDKLMNGIANDVDFKKILSILDFPMESLEDDGLYRDCNANNSPCFEPIPLDALMGLATSPRGRIDHASTPKSIAPPLDNDGAPEQKPLTCIEDTSSSSILNQNKLGAFQTHSPSSVLESSGSYLVEKGLILKSHIDIPRRASARSKQRKSTSSRILTSSISSASDRSQSSGKNKEAKRKKSSQMPDTMETINKKCTHCEVTKTPQWREGPMGPRTLCNACGVQYRSGHLFPEYRPAASPTFVPSLHSNSHKKIIGMRNKGKEPAMEV